MPVGVAPQPAWMRVLAAIAAVGFFASLAVHVCALLGIDAQARFPFVWLLHVGIFVVFVPAAIAQKRASKPGSRSSWNDLLLPAWMKALGPVLFIYAIVNFMIAMHGAPGKTRLDHGRHVVVERGAVVRVLADEEFHANEATVLRMFSGHWMMFYAGAFAMLYARRRDEP